MSDEASRIASATLQLLKDGFGDIFKTFRPTPILQVAPEQLPLLGVFILRERRRTDGDVNVGPPAFVHELTIGIAGAAAIKSIDQAELTWLEEVMSNIDTILLTNARWVMMTEGVLSMDRQSQYSMQGETPLCEIRVEVVLQFRSRFEPVIADVLERVHIETRYPTADVDPAVVQQVSAAIDLETQ